jgi:glycerol-3-phosphate O-acyltransferase/dihydroxyacetone phosphate acyltransferase
MADPGVAQQFLDPLLLMSEVRRESGRRISFLTAAKSMDRAFVGLAARLAQSSKFPRGPLLLSWGAYADPFEVPRFQVPVARAQDYAFVGKGTIRLSEQDPLTILGTDTQFTKDFEKPRSQMLLPRNLGSSTAEVIEVVSDTELRLKKEFPRKAVEDLKTKTEGVSFKVRWCSRLSQKEGFRITPRSAADTKPRAHDRFCRTSTSPTCTRPSTNA